MKMKFFLHMFVMFSLVACTTEVQNFLPNNSGGGTGGGGSGTGSGGGAEVAGRFLNPGDIIVSNSGSSAIIALSENGDFSKLVLNVGINAESVFGIAWSKSSKELLIAVDGSDRILAVDAETGSVRTLVTNANLSGILRGLAQLVGGDLLIIESNVIERFTPSGIRVTAGGFPLALQTTPFQISPMLAGGFVLCSTGTDIVGTYNSAGALITSRVSGIAGTTNGQGCMELSDTRIATAWSGTTDTVAIYSPNLLITEATFSDVPLLGDPGGIGERSNGNLLVVDRAFHYLVEITPDGDFVDIVGDGLLNTPEQVLVIPAY